MIRCFCSTSETDAVRRYYLRRAAGSTRYGLATGTIEATPIKIAPLGSQRAISRILRALDTQIEATEALIAKQERVRAGLMQDLFTRGINEHGQLRRPREEAPHLYYQTELGWLPKGWEAPELASLLAHTPTPMRSGPFGSALLKHELVASGIPFLGIDNIHIEQFKSDFVRFVPPPPASSPNYPDIAFFPMMWSLRSWGRLGAAVSFLMVLAKCYRPSTSGR